MKTTTTKSKNTPVADVNVNYIEETLKLVESNEMREHLSKWFASGEVRRPLKECADIIYLSLSPIEYKLSMLQGLSKHDDVERPVISPYIREIQRVIKGCNTDSCSNNPDGHDYYLFLDSFPNDVRKGFDSLNEAIGHIKSLNAQADSDTNDLSYYKSLMAFDIDDLVSRIKFVRTQVDDDSMDEAYRDWINIYRNKNIAYKIAKYNYTEEDGESEENWFLNEDGEIVYFNGSMDTPTYVNIPMPFQPGDIVITGGNPFTEERKVVILYNNDTFDSVDSDGITCLYKNRHGKLDVGQFKFCDFQINSSCCVPALYRARIYKELSDCVDDYIFSDVSKVIKNNPMLGREIYNRLNSFQMLDLSFTCHSHTQSTIRYQGVNWFSFRKGFGL